MGLRNHPRRRCIEAKGVAVGTQHGFQTDDGIAAFAHLIRSRRSSDLPCLVLSRFCIAHDVGSINGFGLVTEKADQPGLRPLAI